ncbi:dihydrodipicolinate reductase [Streptomyces bingchenggensis BCW-1]|uniref:Dihydrodipicolinate reductase n=1 Tax=Streptomyces bingchenggensis (strain BCW-1) TaxID=749414 RepID=D7C679_STRBB|nr:dihydrodipicolinate reductase C-terminal domain-containing protein [Streptomyces bingchenggensis]ADI04067.1 dihydrodipicolinate reductase [Streptomyces bingchenggensis BCW-1]
MPPDQRSGPGLRVGVVGATGRLGSRIVAECALRDVPVVMTAHRGAWTAEQPPTVVIDASRGEVLPRTVAYCRETGSSLIACASDIGPDGEPLLAELAGSVTVVRAVNLSLGHWLQDHLLGVAGRLLRTSAMPLPRVSLLERHARAKRDRPSASARSLAATWEAHAGGAAVDEVASFRAGHQVSEHVVQLDFAHESLRLHHDVRDLSAAAPGALAVAAWADGAPAGLVTVKQVYDRLFFASAHDTDRERPPATEPPATEPPATASSSAET